ncbi:MAG: hypothetical protein U1C12_00695, partial [Patescibacteria group bacterium]|nr:hypothetical protein [Patescibacteria group bacterium]
MGKLEEKSREKSKRKNLQYAILQAVATVGVLSIGLVAPNVIKALSRLGIIPNNRQREYIASSASKLVKRGLLSYNGKKYCLT